MMLYYTHAFYLTYGIGRVCKNREYLLDIKTRGNIVSVIKLHHAKIARSGGRRHPQKKQWHALVPVSHRRVVLFPEKTLWRSIRGVEGVLCCCY